MEKEIKLLREIAISSGVTSSTFQKWRERGRVPYRHRLPFCLIAQERGININPLIFENLSRPRAATEVPELAPEQRG